MFMLEVLYIKFFIICVFFNYMRFKFDEKMIKNVCNLFDFLIKRLKFCILWKFIYKNMDKFVLCLFENLIWIKVVYFNYFYIKCDFFDRV